MKTSDPPEIPAFESWIFIASKVEWDYETGDRLRDSLEENVRYLYELRWALAYIFNARAEDIDEWSFVIYHNGARVWRCNDDTQAAGAKLGHVDFCPPEGYAGQVEEMNLAAITKYYTDLVGKFIADTAEDVRRDREARAALKALRGPD